MHRGKPLIAIAISALSLVLVAGCGEQSQARPTAERTQQVIDVCANLDGAQEEMPAGYDYGEEVDCEKIGTSGTEADGEGTSGAAATVTTLLESGTGTRIRVTFDIGAPVNGLEALGSPVGQTLQAGCNAANLSFWLENNSTQAVPVSWSAVDETTGGFQWDAWADLNQKLVLPASGLVASESISVTPTMDQCQPANGLILFGPGTGVALPFERDVYTPNNPDGGFGLVGFKVGASGGIIECDIAIDDAAFNSALTAVDSTRECLVTGN